MSVEEYEKIWLESARRSSILDEYEDFILHLLIKHRDVTILIRDGSLMEGTSTDIFIVKNEVTHISPADDYILEVITRNTVLNLIDKRGYSSKARYIKAQELFSTDEVFLTGT